MFEFDDDLTSDDACTNAPEMTDEEKDAFFASLDQPEMTDEELDEMAAFFEGQEAPDFDGYVDGHRDSFYW
jgi:hypothetical protein